MWQKMVGSVPFHLFWPVEEKKQQIITFLEFQFFIN